MVGLEAIPHFEELETREGPQIISKHGIITSTNIFLIPFSSSFNFSPYSIFMSLFFSLKDRTNTQRMSKTF
jgi:hypothetical protein